MRHVSRLVLVAAVAAAVALPTSSANAVYCGALDPACDAICRVGELIHAECAA